MHRQKLIQLLQSFGSKIFSVQYIKKDGTYREDNVRLSVKKYVKGTGKSPSKPTNDIVTAFRMFNMQGQEFTGYQPSDRPQYFSLKLSNIVQVKCGGHTYKIVPEPISDLIDLSDSFTNQPVDDNIIAITA